MSDHNFSNKVCLRCGCASTSHRKLCLSFTEQRNKLDEALLQLTALEAKAQAVVEVEARVRQQPPAHLVSVDPELGRAIDALAALTKEE